MAPKNVVLVSQNRTVSPRSPILSSNYNDFVKTTTKDLANLKTQLNAITTTALKLHTDAWLTTTGYHGIDANTIYWDSTDVSPVTIAEKVTGIESDLETFENDLTASQVRFVPDTPRLSANAYAGGLTDDNDHVQHVLEDILLAIPSLQTGGEITIGLDNLTIDGDIVQPEGATYNIGTSTIPWTGGFFTTLTADTLIVETTTTLNSTTVTTGDKNIVLASGATSQLEADGGGITLKVGAGSGASDVRSILYSEQNDAWVFDTAVIVDGSPIGGGLADNSVKANHIDWEDGSGPNQVDADNIPEGSTNKWYTDVKVDARIAAANLFDLVDVATPASGDHGYYLSYDHANTNFEWVAPSSNNTDIDVDTTNLLARLGQLDDTADIVIGNATTTTVEVAGGLEAQTLTTVGSVTGSTFFADPGELASNGYRFASVDGNKAGIQYSTTSGNLFINAENHIFVHLNRGNTTGAEFIVEDFDHDDLFKIYENSGNCWIQKGNLTIAQDGINLKDEYGGDFNAEIVAEDSSGTSDTLAINLEDTSGGTNQLYLDIEDVTPSGGTPCVRIAPTKAEVGSAAKPALMVGGAGNLGFRTASKDGHIRCNDVGGKLIFEAGDGTNVGEVAKMGPGGLEVVGGGVGITNTDAPALTIRTATTGNDPSIYLKDGTGTKGVDIFYEGSSEQFRIVGHPAVGNPALLLKLDADNGQADLYQSLDVTGNITATGSITGGSSRGLKKNIKNLSQRDADAAFAMLNPKKFEYKSGGKEHLGFIAEDVHDLVATEDRKGLSSMDIIAVLAKVMQKQSKALDKQSKALSKQQKQISKLERALKAKK